MGKGFGLCFFDDQEVQWLTPKIAHVKNSYYPNTFITTSFDYRQNTNTDIVKNIIAK
ncbi:hypothetical protein TYM08_P1027 [Marinicellulosiphila megalodicopiae]